MAGSESDGEVEAVEIEREESPLARRVVRPPLVWVGIGAALIGMIVIGVALVTPVEWVAFIGAAIVIAGGVFAWWHGVLADAHGGGTTEAVDEDLPDDAHVGTLPGDRLHDERAISEAARTEAALAGGEGVERVARPASPSEQGRAAAVFLAISAAWLILTVPMFALEPPNQYPGLRQGGAAIVIAVAAVRMLVTGPTVKWAVVAAAASALLLISLAVWWPEFERPRITGLVGGIVALAAAASVIVALNPKRHAS